jgi:transposase
MNRIEVITSTGRRQRWSRADKVRLVAAMREPDAIATEIARKAGVDPSLLYRWRRQLCGPRETPAFVPVQVTEEIREPARAPDRAAISIAFGAHVRVTIEGAPDTATLSAVIGALTTRDR